MDTQIVLVGVLVFLTALLVLNNMRPKGGMVKNYNHVSYMYPNPKQFKRKEVKDMNMHLVAVELTEAEGKKEQISIAQVKEVLSLLFKRYTLEQIIKMWFKYNK